MSVQHPTLDDIVGMGDDYFSAMAQSSTPALIQQMSQLNVKDQLKLLGWGGRRASAIENSGLPSSSSRVPRQVDHLAPKGHILWMDANYACSQFCFGLCCWR